MKSFFVVLSMFCLARSAGAQPAGTVDQFLSGLLSMSSTQCQGNGEAQAKLYESNGKLAEAHSIRSAEKMLCECMPEQIKEVRAKLSKMEKSHRISEAEFSKVYLPAVMNTCVGEQFRSTYGSGCAERFARFTTKSGPFCSCMSRRLSTVTDAEVAVIGKASADYLPLAAEAKRRGQPAPEKPAALQAFGAIEASCLNE